MVRNVFLSVCAALALTACADGTRPVTAPNGTDPALAVAQMSASMYGSDAVTAEAAFSGFDDMWGLNQLPDSLKLTADQQAQVTALVTAYRDSTQALRAQLDTIRAKAVAAHKAGASRDSVRAILATGAPLHMQLQAQQTALRAAIWKVLTPAQQAWLTAHRHGQCDDHAVQPLTSDQRTQIQALVQAFQANNQADIKTVLAARQSADSARHAGATQAQVQAILATAQPALDRLKTAAEALRVAISAVIGTNAQAMVCINDSDHGQDHGGDHGP
ncbi:MAG TPA: Spy/CpxP family protein refolding chaperone [Gemmatimonadaceae bacterium]|jgi:Spy/CpxP family protein refolding chaperone|nr:Spy/CpxP family protein refolding chaperone [Gemmatimonadaceae bacterium]